MFDYSVLFSSLPFLFEHLRKAQFQLGVESYLRVEQVLVQLAMQGKLSSELSELKQQLFNYLRPLLCHSPVEQQLFSKHFEEWWSTFIQIPELSSAQEIQIKQVKKKITRFGILVFLLVCAIVGAGHWHLNRFFETSVSDTPPKEIPKETPKEEIKKPPSPDNPQPNPKPLRDDGQPIQQQQVDFKEPPNTFQNLAFSNSRYVALSFAGLLAILLFYLLFLRWRTQQFLNRYAVTQQFATQTVYVQEMQQRLFQSVEFGQTAQQLRVHELVETNDLDVMATIEKTLRAGNYFSPVFARMKRTPEYLILVDKQSFSDHHAALVDNLVARLQSEGVEVTRFYFHGDPQICYQNPQRGVNLARLFAMYGTARLLIFSDGAGLLDGYGELHVWVRGLLAWNARSVLTLHDLRGWEARALLRESFWVLPASESGLKGLVALLQAQGNQQQVQWDGSPMPSILAENSLRWLGREEPTAEEAEVLLQQLRDFLGERGFEWLCACAVWHELRWQMTLFLGYQLFGQQAARLSLLGRLARLIWFKTGFMPDWLRRLLIQQLSFAQQKLLRQQLFSLFEQAQAVPSTQDAMAVSIATQRAKGRAKVRDVVFLEFAVASGLGVRVPRVVGELLGRRVAMREMVLPLFGLFVMIASIWVFNQTIAPPLPPIAEVTPPIQPPTTIVESSPPIQQTTPVLPKKFLHLVHSETVRSAAYSPDGMRIVTASYKEARVWDAQMGQAILTLQGHSDAVNSAAYSPDGTRIVTASLDKTARVWDAQTGQAILTLKGHEYAVNSAAYSPDGTRIVTASNDKTAREWDAQTEQTILTLKGHKWSVYSAAYNPDGTRIVTASQDNTSRVWDAQTGWVIGTLKGHSYWVFSAVYSPDGTQIVTASMDNTARVWDAQTGQTIRTLQGHSSDVNSATYSPDGTRIVTASRDKTARVWDALTGQAIRTLQGHTDYVRSAAYSPDGTRIVTASDDNTARVWDAQTGEMISQDLSEP